MKRLIFVFGDERDSDFALKFTTSLDNKDRQAIFVEGKNSKEALDQFNKEVHSTLFGSDGDLIACFGTNLDLIKAKYPDESIDVPAFKSALIDFIGGYETEGQKYLVDGLFRGGFLNLLSGKYSWKK